MRTTMLATMQIPFNARSLVRRAGIGAALAAGILALSPGFAFAQSGNLNVDADGNWSTSSNWNPAAGYGRPAHQPLDFSV